MTDHDLIAELRWALGLAAGAGADRGRLDALSNRLVDLMLDRMDPRRQRSSVLALKVAQARAAGVGVPDLCERFGKSRSQINRLIRLAHDFTRQFSAEVTQ